jgi:NAD(P)-dependent dehydrogenase (short-subunit alcohol dehydrogenase family)
VRDLEGRTCVVTGANSGIGRVTARELARRGARVVLACRSRERTEAALDETRRAGGDQSARFLELNLASFDSVRRAAAELLAGPEPIQVLINNAGLAGRRGRTADGFELTFGVNHLGHFLLTHLLLGRIRDSAPARIVTVASKAHFGAHGIDFDSLRARTASATGFPEYEVSKLANVLFSAELGRRLRGTGVTTYSLHPGVVASGIWRNVPWPVRPLLKLFMKSNDEGARTTLWCATSPDLASETGLYYDECTPRKPSAVARDEALGRELWRRSLDWCGIPEGTFSEVPVR